MNNQKRTAAATLETLRRIFTVPEAPNSTLGQIDRKIARNLAGFLQEHIVASEKGIPEIQKDFSDAAIPETPIFVSEQAEFLLQKLVAQSVHTASPSFVGHMASALPYFMLPLSRIMIALNQNLVKTETSKAFTPLERQVLGLMHRLVYGGDESFYQKWMHDPRHALGAFCSGGTIANLTALWVARNQAFAADGEFQGIGQEGLFAACWHYDCEGAAVLVSKRGHYSLGKAIDILGIGRRQLVSIETDAHNKVRVDQLQAQCCELRERGIRPIAIVGIAGTTETGNVDPLDELADVAREHGCHFHVDAAWGGATLFSHQHRHLLNGIDRADSVTIDAHKQLYVPMGAGLVVFKDPTSLNTIEHHAEYIIRKGSHDLGSTTLEGSRPGMAMLVHSGLRIIGRQGYELLINDGIDKARRFAGRIGECPDFELTTEPELNILTYRYRPQWAESLLQSPDEAVRHEANEILSRIIRYMQKTQRARGKSFVSRTRLTPERYRGQPITVFRVVLANPLTTLAILDDVLTEQRELASLPRVVKWEGRLRNLLEESDPALCATG